MECDPKGKCPKCGYQNEAAAQRCVRCRASLMAMSGCSGACSKCLVKMPSREAKS